MYLLDTCAFLYYLEWNPKLSKKAAAIIEAKDDVFLSQTSLWEIAIKKTIGKLELEESTYDLVAICEEGGIGILPIKNSYFETIQRLPMIHNDPFDRMIIATALGEGLTVLSDDGQFPRYEGLECIW